MAAHQLAVAKASLASGLLRADPTSLSQHDIAQFHLLLDAAIQQCSPSNVQKVKEWLVKNTLPSPKRIAQLGKYLAVLAQSFANAENTAPQKRVKRAGPSNKRKGIHLLYIVTDLHHHTKNHAAGFSVHSRLVSSLQPHLEDVVRAVASTGFGRNVKLHKSIRDLLALFEKRGFYKAIELGKLHKAVDDADPTASTTTNDTQVRPKDVPYVLPATHGDPSDPWYELPAANMLPHMVPNDRRPIPTRQMKAMRLDGGPADSALINAVKDLISWSEDLYNDDENVVADMDMMGQPLVRDEVTGELNVAENYYGWSVEFCERMKKRMKEGPPNSNDKVPARRRSLSRGRSSSRSPPHKRRYSLSPSRSRSRSRDGKRMRDDRRSYSRPRGGLGQERSRGRGSRSRTPRRSRSRSPGGYRNYRRLSPRNRSRSRSYSPPRSVRPLHRPAEKSQFRQQPTPPGAYPGQQFPTPPPPPQAFPGQFSGFPMGGAAPPPPQPSYNGAWPPPPPPPMAPTNGFNQQGSYQQFAPPYPPQLPPYGASPPPPPPPIGYPMPGGSPPTAGFPGFPPNPPWGQPQYSGYGGSPHNGHGQWQQQGGYDRGRGRR